MGHRGRSRRRIDDHSDVSRLGRIDKSNHNGVEIEVEFHEHNLPTLRNVSACLNLPNATLLNSLRRSPPG